MAHLSKQTVSERIELRKIEKRAVEALRDLCRDQEEVNSLLWAMVQSIQQAQQDRLEVH